MILFIDGFDHYGVVGSVFDFHSEKWGNISGNVYLSETNPRRTGGRHARISDDSYWIEHLLEPAEDTVCLGLAIRLSAAASGSGGVAFVRSRAIFGSVTSSTFSVRFNADGSVEAFRGGWTTGTSLGASAASTINTLTWYYVEIRVTVHDSTGSFDVWVTDSSGVRANVLSGSGVDTKGQADTGVDAIRVTGFVDSDDTFVDDVYVSDGDALGDCRVDTLWPVAAGFSAEWAPDTSGVDNYSRVDESLPDDDTTYVESGVATDVDTYGFGDLGNVGASQIFAVAVTSYARKTDAGQRKVTPTIRRGSTNYQIDERPTFDHYFALQGIAESPPDSPSTDWTLAEINASEFGMEMMA